MSNFMEHIHRGIDTPPLFDGNALGCPVEYDLVPTDNRGSVRLANAGPRATETPGHRPVSADLACPREPVRERAAARLA
jgi:hypothetical protein